MNSLHKLWYTGDAVDEVGNTKIPNNTKVTDVLPATGHHIVSI